MWPFKKKPAVGTASKVEEILKPKPKVDVGFVRVVLILEDSTREEFSIPGKLTCPAKDGLRNAIESSHRCGFLGFGDGTYIRWIPTRRVKEIYTTEWPYEIDQ
jgi:hypothetical protein